MTQEPIFVHSISISGLISLQLHALNNEGNEGNQSMTRRYYIVEKGDAEPKFVNGISGDMLKHIQAEHLQRIAVDEGLALSEGGKQGHPDRIGYDLDQNLPVFSEDDKDLATKIQKVLQRCTISDLEGFMVTEKRGPTLKRESVIEFGTVIGVPTFVKTQSYFHAKYGTENPTPYNVQVNSGLYATILNIEAFRIGYNPHTFDYAISPTERKQRLDALLKSILYTYLQPNGAKRNTLLPHPDYFEGTISISTRRCPAPMVSPLEFEYQRQITSLADTLNRINGDGTIQVYSFETIAEFAEQIEELINLIQPYQM
ncbi:DevR family CRISPR-associated autoregulator [Aphanothece hegewaldii CCALA 016]|uniref:DevR family CRISPR-associated autoregulator n=1 Tax=Aphanothece hegewaldii CCALA 016 TaxID=2107694 RepID=A0A2T1LYC4_9CHRO|nr:DevR family CRISPR-associated autoregulator [Aphanothece hegewaldii]PSF37393.1 DevR family CRISPR-associated autoregulator [Aphanothece hegewaldii CCALA 016]